jgi:hypothetical protein
MRVVGVCELMLDSLRHLSVETLGTIYREVYSRRHQNGAKSVDVDFSGPYLAVKYVLTMGLDSFQPMNLASKRRLLSIRCFRPETWNQIKITLPS